MSSLLQPEIEQIATPIIDSLKKSGLFQNAIAQAVADRLVETAEEMTAAACRVVEGFDFTEDIRRAVEGQGFSEGLQKRLDSIGVYGEVVSLRMKMAFMVEAETVAKLREEKEKTLLIEVEAKEAAIEARYQLERNYRLTRMSWILNIFSLWPVVCLIVVFGAAGFAGGVAFVRNQQNIQVVR